MSAVKWEIRGGAMQEEGYHTLDGWDVWLGDERAEDSFSVDPDEAQLLADQLNEDCGLT